jgi:hypothetical protein
MKISGSLEVTGSVGLTGVSTVGVGDTYIDFTTGDEINFWAGGERLLSIDEAATDEVVVGDGGDVNFRVATAGYGYNLYVKSSNAGGVDNSVGIRNSAPQSVLDVTGDITATHVTASGNISASGTITAEQLTTSDDLTVGDKITTEYGDVNIGLTANKDSSAAGDFIVKSLNLNRVLYTDANKDRVGIGFHNPGGSDLLSSFHVSGDITATHVTASGNISASGTIYADNFTSTGGDVAGISFADDLNITGHITASGDINTTAGRVYEAGTSVIDHATAMAIVFGG